MRRKSELQTSTAEKTIKDIRRGTPAIVFRTEEGKVETFAGMPSEGQMEVFLGPK